MTQKWEPDTCKCIIYSNGSTYQKYSNEQHCNKHIKLNQQWLDEVIQHNNSINHKYFSIGYIITQKDKIKSQQLQNEKQYTKSQS